MKSVFCLGMQGENEGPVMASAKRWAGRKGIRQKGTKKGQDLGF